MREKAKAKLLAWFKTLPWYVQILVIAIPPVPVAIGMVVKDD